MRGPFFGKFRGVVSDNRDPLFMGRVRAKVPDVFGDDNESGWAMACAPFVGKGQGFFAVPDVGVGVWLEFEHGDPEYPVWTGCWWGSMNDIPQDALPLPTQKVVLKSIGGHTLTLDDTPGTGGVIIQTSTGQKVSITATGIEIDNGQGGSIKLQGPQVSVNDDGLQVI